MGYLQQVAATILQSSVRRQLAIRKVDQLRRERVAALEARARVECAAATRLQASARRRLAAKRCAVLLQKKRTADAAMRRAQQVAEAVLLQATATRQRVLAVKHYNVLRKEQMAVEQAMREAQDTAATVIQSTWRRSFALQQYRAQITRREVRAARIVQSMVHDFLSKCVAIRPEDQDEYEQQAVHQIKALSHEFLAHTNKRPKAEDMKRVVLEIQAIARVLVTNKKLQQEETKRNAAATDIQRIGRSYLAKQTVKTRARRRRELQFNKQMQKKISRTHSPVGSVVTTKSLMTTTSLQAAAVAANNHHPMASRISSGSETESKTSSEDHEERQQQRQQPTPVRSEETYPMKKLIQVSSYTPPTPPHEETVHYPAPQKFTKSVHSGFHTYTTSNGHPIKVRHNQQQQQQYHDKEEGFLERVSSFRVFLVVFACAAVYVTQTGLVSSAGGMHSPVIVSSSSRRQFSSPSRRRTTAKARFVVRR